MFFKKIFFGTVLFSCSVFSVSADNDIITLRGANREIMKVVPCNDCPMLDDECKSYIATSTDRICIPSYAPTKNISEKVKTNMYLLEEANHEDLQNLENDLNYSASHSSRPVTDMNLGTGSEPLVE